MKSYVLVFSSFVLSACAMDEAAKPIGPAPSGSCDVSALQNYVGSKVSEKLGSELSAKSGAQIFQWVPPRTPVTKDYRQERLRVSYDDNQMITRIACG